MREIILVYDYCSHLGIKFSSVTLTMPRQNKKGQDKNPARFKIQYPMKNHCKGGTYYYTSVALFMERIVHFTL